MSLKCKLGFHNWVGCKCTDCGKIRDEQHDWSKDCEKCSICGEKRDFKHNWNGCKCSLCGKIRNEQHEWNGCICSKCDKIRDEQHDWLKDCEECSKCYKTRINHHVWKGYICEVCNTERPPLEGFNSEEATLVFPWLEKVKENYRHNAMIFKGSFGGMCDSCCGGIEREHFYLKGSSGYCERCMDRRLFECNWGFYLKEPQTWLGYLPPELVKEATSICKEIDVLRGK